MREGKRYRLKIRGNGIVRYYCTDGKFWNIRANAQARPYHFSGRVEAQNMYVAWARQYPATASTWIPEIEEV